ncbi:MAG TPA: pseudouridine synthase [Myxococcota bacterium]|nr:pseudouridine synthase [Myxococcota bacterium]
MAKPPHVVVHRGRDTWNEYAALQRTRDLVGCHVYPIHRLDRPASGCLLFATRRERAGELHAALKRGTKTYVCLVRGHFKHDSPTRVTTPIRDEGKEKEAASVVECLGKSHEPRCSLLRVRPETGRFHQIRRHVRDLHHPILGDRAHGDHRENHAWKAKGLDQLALHAIRLELELPEGPLRAVSPLFPRLHRVLVELPWWSEVLDAEPDLRLPPLEWVEEDEE